MSDLPKKSVLNNRLLGIFLSDVRLGPGASCACAITIIFKNFTCSSLHVLTNKVAANIQAYFLNQIEFFIILQIFFATRIGGIYKYRLLHGW